MNRILKLILVIIAFAASAVALALGCTGGNQAAPVLGEAPVPVVLKFVEFDELQIDKSQLTGGTSASISKEIQPGDPIDDVLRSSSLMVLFFEDQLLIPITEGLGAIEIPVRSDIQAFEGSVTFTQFSYFVEDSFFGTHNVKLDFRDFDYDDDGFKEGCSGSTAILPVCVRFWLDDTQFIAWVFEKFPITPEIVNTAKAEGDEVQSTVGKGRFKVFLDDIDGLGWEIALAYDEDLGENPIKEYDIFMKGTNNGLSEIPYFGDALKLLRRRMGVSQEGPEEVALKTIESNQYAFYEQGGDTGTSVGKTLERYIEGFDYWAASYYGSLIGVSSIIGEQDQIISEQNVCASISQEVAVDPLECSNVNGQDIRVLEDPDFPDDGHPFIFAATDADVAFPSDFTAAPPADFDSLPKP